MIEKYTTCINPSVNKGNIIRRICLFAGPGCGKSTAAASIYHILKNKKVSCELVREFIKDWAYDGIHPRSLDQFLISSEQIRREDIPLRNGVKYIVTDSPILLSSVYAPPEIAPIIEDMVKVVDSKYPPLNVFIDRDDSRFKQEGRFQTLEESKEKDQEIRVLLKRFYGGFFEIDGVHDTQKIINLL